MDILAFIAKITDSLAWPAATVIGIWLIKGHLFEFISSLGFNIKYGEWNIDIKKAISDLKDSQTMIATQQNEIEQLIKNINRTEPKKQDL